MNDAFSPRRVTVPIDDRFHKQRLIMPMLKRLQYALYVLVAVSMIAMLGLSVGEGIGLVHGFDIGGLVSHPLYVLSVFAVGFVIAPAFAEHMPISGDLPSKSPRNKLPFGYAVRSSLLVAFGFAIVVLLGIVLFLVDRFA